MWRNLKLVKLLYKQGANIHDRSASNKTPLMFSVAVNHVEAARFLLKKGVERMIIMMIEKPRYLNLSLSL